MNREDFLDEQKNVLNELNKNLIISASAGSGKTTVMIQRIIEDITIRKKDIKKILVLTYTKASAEEMKQRLVKELYEKALEDSNLATQIDEVAISDISTIHSFFQKCIKKYFNIIDIDPNFSIIDETQSRKIIEIALENTLEKFGNEYNENFEQLLNIFGKSRNGEKIKNIIQNVVTFLKAIPNEDEWKTQNAVALYEKDLSKNLSINMINSNIYETSKYYSQRINSVIKKLDNEDLGKYVEIGNSLISYLNSIKPEQEHLFNNCENISNFPKTKTFASEDVANIEIVGDLKQLKDELKKYSTNIKSMQFTQENVEDFLNTTPSIIKSILKLTEIYGDEYSKLKVKNNVLDYDDLEKFMLKLLENEDVKQEIIANYDEIYVDEYQDANRIQEKILSLICKENNRFMVGDVKQSIYRFRQAEPDIFLENQKLFETDKNSAVLYINYNFRSEKKILNFVNLIFENIMTIKTAKIDYTKSKFDGRAEYKVVEGQNIPQVEIDIIKQQKDEKPLPTSLYTIKDHKNQTKNYSSAELEAVVVAEKISKIIGQKIYIPSEKQERSIEYKDITILLKSRGEYLNEFCKILANFNIPIYANSKEKLYEDSDVQLLIHLLTLCINKNNDIALASVMHSVFGDFSYNELALIRKNANDTFYNCVINYNIQNKILTKIQKFNKFINDLSYNIIYNGIYHSLNKNLTDYGFWEYLLAKKDGIIKQGKVQKFINDFLSNSFNNNLVGFLDYADKNIDNIVAPNFIGGENCVNITTIHSSKGLEFPIVFLVRAGQDLNKNKEEKSILLNRQLGIGLDYYNTNTRKKLPSTVIQAIKLENKKENFAENLRLLYVGLTRAKNHLIIVGTTNNEFSSIKQDFEILRQKSYLDLIVNSLPQDVIKSINDNKDINEDLYTINIINKYPENNFLENDEISIKPVSNAELEKTIINYYEYEYPYNTDITIKNSVSSILQSENPYISKNFAPEKFTFEEHSNIMANELGTKYHELLEKIDFKTANLQSIIKLIEKYYKNYPINPQKILKCINVIKQFDLKTIIKEQKFVMQVPYNLINNSQITDKILVQGIIDLIILGKKNILIDYKLTNEQNEEKIIKKYKLQLKLYKKATELAINSSIDEVYILLINSGKLVKIY